VENGAALAAGGQTSVTFAETFTDTRTFCVTTAAAALKPSAISVWTPTGIRNSHLEGADYILVTSRAFLPSVQPLLAYRRSQGLRAVGVAMEDIYGEFSYGIEDPQALQDFLTWAYRNWTPPAPRFVLLVGDASFDYRNFEGCNKANIVPVHLSLTSDLGLTPDDNWYVTLGSASEMPAMMIGRLTAATPAAAAAQVQKVIQYEESPAPVAPRALFVADDDDDADFGAACEDLVALLPSAVAPQRVYTSQYSSIPSGPNGAILSDLDAGVCLAAYFGHGNVGFWTRDILQDSDVALLANGTSQPFVQSFDCLGAYFADPHEYSLGETLVSAPGNGAIAFFGSAGFGLTWEHVMLGEAMYTSLFQGHVTSLGTLCTQAKLSAYAQGATLDMVRMFVLLGDPAMNLKPFPASSGRGSIRRRPIRR
jgi:hypothetical protein